MVELQGCWDVAGEVGSSRSALTIERAGGLPVLPRWLRKGSDSTPDVFPLLHARLYRGTSYFFSRLAPLHLADHDPAANIGCFARLVNSCEPSPKLASDHDSNHCARPRHSPDHHLFSSDEAHVWAPGSGKVTSPTHALRRRLGRFNVSDMCAALAS